MKLWDTIFMKKTILQKLPIVVTFVFALGLLLRPSDRAREGNDVKGAYFKGLNQALLTAQTTLPCAVLDLDRLDHNIDSVRSSVRSPRSLRVVVKSLPSFEMLRYILRRAETRKVMVFHAPQINPLLAALGELDILLGKPMPVGAARAVLKDRPASAQNVQWLVDTSSRLGEYLNLARERKMRIKIALEIDVGMRRGGARDVAELVAILAEIRAHSDALQFSGLMGYDGHVTHAPSFLGFGKADAVARAFRRTQEAYADFVGEGRKRQPELFAPGRDLTLNSGGSRTYSMYEKSDSLVNDLAMGSGFVMPSDFAEEPSLAAHESALFLAVPILKKLDTQPIPFMGPLWGLLTAWDRNLARGFYIYGSVWDSEVIFPKGLRPGWFYEPVIRNLLPNQALLSGSASVEASVGDFAFMSPHEGDAMAVYQEIVAIRSGQVFAHWHPLPTLN